VSGFFPDKELKNESADEPWKKSETDKMLDLYFEGAHPKRIAQQLARNPKAVRRRLEQFSYNERDRAVCYDPFRRVSRKKKKMTQNELTMWDAHRERKVPVAITAKVLCRDVTELDGSSIVGTMKSDEMRGVAPRMDLIWAHRYIHFVWKTPIITDKAYDDLVEEEIEYGGGLKAFATIKLHQGWPDYIKSLALYLHEKYKEEKQKK
jgi:hypothetical protein